MGYVDPNSGTHFYASTDPLSTTTIYSVLNEAQVAEHNARLNDRARIKALEDNALIIHTITPTGFMTLPAGYSFESGKTPVIRRIGARIEFSLHIQKTSGPLVHGQTVGTIKTEWKPMAGTEWQLVSRESGGGTASGGMAAVLQPSGNIVTLTPNGTSTTLSVSGFYHLV